MSRVGKKPIPVPSNVELNITDRTVSVKGPKGELSFTHRPEVSVVKADQELQVTINGDSKMHHALHGLTRSLVSNMVQGVTAGYEKQLEIVGVGYSAELKGKSLLLNLGYSHQILLEAPEGIAYTVPAPTKVTVSGIDKQKVGEVSAKIRSFRPPEPYKGKGVKYVGEQVRRKAGKTVKS